MKKIKIEHDGSAFIQCDDGGDYHLLLEGGSLSSRVRLTARRSSPSRDTLMHAVLERRIAQMAFDPFDLPNGYQVHNKPLGLLNPAPNNAHVFEFSISSNSDALSHERQLDLIVEVSRDQPAYMVQWMKLWKSGQPGLSPQWQVVVRHALLRIATDHLPELGEFTASFASDPFMGGPELNDTERALETIVDALRHVDLEQLRQTRSSFSALSGKSLTQLAAMASSLRSS